MKYAPIYGFVQGMVLGKEVDGRAVYLNENELKEVADKLNKLEEKEAVPIQETLEEPKEDQ